MRKQEGTSILSLHPGAKRGCKTSKTGKCTECPLYRFVETKHPQTGEDVREWDCIFVWQVMWSGQTALEVNRTHAGINSMRNESAKQYGDFVHRMESAKQARLPRADS